MAYKNNKGFTIVELMIAISIFTTAMVLVLAGVIFISRQYQQMSNKIALEEASRNVHQQITQAIQLSSGSIEEGTSGNYKAYCVGNQMYIYGSLAPVSNVSDYTQQVSNRAGLYIKNNLNNCLDSDVNLNPDANGVPVINLLPEGAIVSKFSISPTGDVVTNFVKAPSDGELVSIPSSGPTVGEITCNTAITGREFCATVRLESSAVQRLGN